MTLNILRIRRERKERAKFMRDLEIFAAKQKARQELMDELSAAGYDFVHLVP